MTAPSADPPTAGARPHAPPDEAPYTFLYAGFMIALAAMLGSLFFGEVMKLPPCSLCWYQRVCLFPLPVILAVGIGGRDRRVLLYALPLVVVGLGIAVYHNLLYYGVIPEALSPCTQGVPCSARQIEIAGFLTIPLMSLLAFLSILIALVLHRNALRRHA